MVVAPVSDADTIDPELAATIREDYKAIAELHRDYRDQLTDDTAPTWAHDTLGTCPDDPEHAALWRTIIADAAAYRSTHQVADLETLAGVRPKDRRAELDWKNVESQRAQLLLRQQHHDQAPCPVPEHSRRPYEAPRTEQRYRRI